ncbi:alpha/beta fold hydrolase [Actinorugispora endophytica]|uniref:Pimeloyl-ACP methyl ester carboxylesterase n=1 Tax=Actinorugispora endophytica TaxID=1605990 RepID=A0A4R6UWQ1_9ACTN|nr:alpha/beta hydrolase [Actinorugispora endophytica]TDQ50696.1 pimeloyl-ACP methyl ester carboxylesterase [Actinorugispora endophytica]
MRVPIVLVHGLRLSRSMWRPQLAVLASQGRTVVAPDLPGHGARRGEVFTLGGAVEAVRDAIDSVGGSALVAGLSLGGFVSIAAAAAYPERVAGLVATSCSARPVNGLAHMYRIPTALLGRLPDKGLAVNTRFHRLTLPADGAAAVLDGGLAMEAARSVIEEVTDLDVLGLLAAYPGTVWLINGARDHFRIHERLFLDACADGRLLVVPRAGHMVSLDQPELFTNIVADAADAVAGRAAASEDGPGSPA